MVEDTSSLAEVNCFQHIGLVLQSNYAQRRIWRLLVFARAQTSNGMHIPQALLRQGRSLGEDMTGWKAQGNLPEEGEGGEEEKSQQLPLPAIAPA